MAELEQILGFEIKNKSYYIRALMHRSFLEKLNNNDDSNERLEFLGDSVLSLVVAEYLFNQFPDKDEGFLTKVRAKLVNRVALSDSAEDIGLQQFILISQNLSNKFNTASRTVLSDALEALIGAIYLDHGLQTCRDFLLRILIEPNMKDGDYLVDENYKSQLLEYAQAHKYDIPYYSVIKEEGPQHERIFTVKVTVGSKITGIGMGRNKKSAEQNAAKSALTKIPHSNSSPE
jgi:ribonuclease III